MSNVPHKHAEVIKSWADGKEIEQRDPRYTLTSNPPQKDPWRPFSGTWHEVMEYRVKPEPPVKEYQKSSMTHAELIDACGTIGYDKQAEPNSLMAQGYERIANAAIRHAIDAGQVQVRNADRDMVIAKAVRSAMVIAYCKACILAHPANVNILPLVDLDRVIAGVKP